MIQTMMYLRTNRGAEIVIWIFIASLLFPIYAYSQPEKFFFPILWTILIIFTVIIYIRSQKYFYVFDPLNVFCLAYLTIPITNFYFIQTDFQNTVFFDRISTRHYISLFSYSAFYYWIGLISAIGGYSMLRTPNLKKIRLGQSGDLSDRLIRVTAYLCSGIGIANFLINVLRFSGGNLFQYLSNIALRHHEFTEVGGTTAGYHLLYVGAYLLLYLYMNKKVGLGELIFFVLVSTVVKLSVGRIFGTMVHMMSFAVMFYYFKAANPIARRKLNVRILGAIMILPIIGLGLYFYRIFSSLTAGYGDGLLITELASRIAEQAGFFIFDKGNTPNIALFMKILDSWGQDHGYLYGASFFSGILPLGVFHEFGYNTSFIVQNLWYEHLPSGALPTTAVGEVYMNFGPIGIPFCMFIFGLSVKCMYIYAVKNATFMSLLILTLITLSFISIYPKVDFSNLRVYWVVLGMSPAVVIYCCRKLVKKRPVNKID